MNGSRTAHLRGLIGLTVILIPFTIFLSRALAIEEVSETFVQANELYRDEKFTEAATLYEGILKSEKNPIYYYNLGNVYFKAKKIGLAIVNYERARKGLPRDSDILENLQYVRGLIEYKVDDKRNWFVRQANKTLNLMTFSEALSLALTAYFLFAVGFLISLIRRGKPLLGNWGTAAVLFVFLCSTPLLLKFAESKIHEPAIVTASQAEVRYAPSSSDQIAFRLVEGLEVIIEDRKLDWYRIRLNDDRTGWIAKDQVTLI